MKNWINWVNGTLFLFLIVLCAAFIIQGEMLNQFGKEYRQNHEDAVKRALLLLAHDSAANKRGDALLKGQVETHLEIIELHRKLDSLTQNKKQ